MFPLDFPLSVLEGSARPTERVLDPFCGRGTTNFAARLLGLDSLGVDSSPVAVAITAAKLVAPTVEEILEEARLILARPAPKEVPQGEFWHWAYHPETLEDLCRFREAFLEDCASPARLALRGILLGALHGPVYKTASYLSNQSPRTYAPKPAYALRFWRSRGLRPPRVNILEVIERRARRYYAHPLPPRGAVVLGDSREGETFRSVQGKFHWVITSPPYYGMRTYIPDQWLRGWFLGGPDIVQYDQSSQLGHGSPEHFVADLSRVWQNVAAQCVDGARMVVRFGSLGSRSAEPVELIYESLRGTPWKMEALKPVPPAPKGRRQASTFLPRGNRSVQEYDFFCSLG
ncbi:DNA modification methylase [Thermus scotoductus]|uniref:site-specific DNA-methyltransferase (cytosine-N(4)-specific) n=2 Tax=Thermus scotoductus TaxID=37636 RepID=A0A430S7A9_THESC|nr:DNA modification methylase [Thermus scotoductus]RTH07311.1 DNA modification methylase [Thermus scotoductus]RTH09787.1 DNA modification methylase [Thermus scotoductus]RTH09873.1 DNA modification methylase [Thermus scotoductus]RTH26463.1 DNA modification methylase [Thermus scotoductus]